MRGPFTYNPWAIVAICFGFFILRVSPSSTNGYSRGHKNSFSDRDQVARPLGGDSRSLCPPSLDYSPCACYNYGNGPVISCDVSSGEDFDAIRAAFSRSQVTDHYQVGFVMESATIGIPSDVLSGKRTLGIELYCPRVNGSMSTLGPVELDAFTSTANFTTTFDLISCDLNDHRFDFLQQLHSLQFLSIRLSLLSTISAMPLMLNLKSVSISFCSGFERWYSPSQTPGVEAIAISGSSDIDDAKMNQILNSFSVYYTTNPLYELRLNGNALTRVPESIADFTTLERLSLSDNLGIKSLLTGSLNITSPQFKSLTLSNAGLEVVEPGTFVGNFSSAVVDLRNNNLMQFESAAFLDLLVGMANGAGYVDITENPIEYGCGLKWLIVDNRPLLPYAIGAIANGTNFNQLNPDDLSDC